jgi:2,3-bisphosphoglycerate-dependent phosphoglycerate mutase
MEFYLIRHAQSVNNALPDEQRIEDPPLTEKGHAQAAALAEWIKAAGLTQLISSPFRRALQTAEYIRRETGLAPRVWVDLHEQGGCCSGYEAITYTGRPGLNAAELLAEFPGYTLPPDIDGEGWWKSRPYERVHEAQLRAVRLIERLRTDYGGKQERVAFVSHGTFKQILLGEMFGASVLERNWLGDVYNTAVTKVTIPEGRPRLVFFNAVGHLPLELIT